MENKKEARGFSLLELLIVVTVILIIAAIAIPSLLRSKMSANEASAVGSLRAINGACLNYSTTWGKGFPVSLSSLGPGSPATSITADLIDSKLATGTKSGYTFTYVSGAPANGSILTYTINGNPSTPSTSGIRYFFTDQSTVVRYNFGSPALPSSKPIG